MSEHLPLGGCERYAARDAARQRVLGCQSLQIPVAGGEWYAPRTDTGDCKGELHFACVLFLRDPAQAQR